MRGVAAGSAAIASLFLAFGCAVQAPAGSNSGSGLGANFGNPGAGSDTAATADATKTDTQADAGSADSVGPGPGVDAQATPDGSEAVEDVAATDDLAIVDSEPSADAATDAPAKPDIVLADAKADAKTDAGKDGATDSGAAPNFAAVFDGVIKKYACNSPYCHGDQIGATATVAYPKFLAWTATSKGCQGKAVVVAGDPAGSLLWAKVAPGVATCDEKMPPGGGAGVSAEDAQLVSDWIAAGAKP